MFVLDVFYQSFYLVCLRVLSNFISLYNFIVNHKEEANGTKFMEEFYEKVEEVKGNINLVKQAIKDITELNQNVLQATTNEKEQDYAIKLGESLVITWTTFFPNFAFIRKSHWLKKLTQARLRPNRRSKLFEKKQKH